jgi:formate dehydrogenase subunit gamma
MTAARRVIPVQAETNPSLTAPERAAVQQAVARWQHLPGPLLVVLHAVQQALGYVPRAAVPDIALALNLSRAEVHGVVSFYHSFRQRKPGPLLVQVCRAEACQAVGGEALAAHAQSRLDTAFGTTADDDSATLESVYCLGNCALGPSMTINGELHGLVDAARFDVLIAAQRTASAHPAEDGGSAAEPGT